VLPAATQQTVTVTLRGCDVLGKSGYAVTLTVGQQRLPALIVTPVTAGATPDWELFRAFPIAWAIAVVTLVAAGGWGYWQYYRKEARRAHRPWNWFTWWWRCTLNLSARWSLSDSWASNVTVIGAALAGVFGSSDVLTAVLGSATDPVFALTLLSSAVATGLVGAAPLVLAVFRRGGGVTPFALLAGASLTVGAAGGELAVITLGASHLSLGSSIKPWMYTALIGGAVILVSYTFVTMLGSLPPKSSPKRKLPDTKLKTSDPGKYQKIKNLADVLPEEYLPETIAAAYGEHILRQPAVGRRSAVF
jgi:hypothetical protein